MAAGGRKPQPTQQQDPPPALAPQLLKLFTAMATPAVLVAAICVLFMRISHSASEPYPIRADGRLVTAQV